MILFAVLFTLAAAAGLMLTRDEAESEPVGWWVETCDGIHYVRSPELVAEICKTMAFGQVVGVYPDRGE